MKNDWREFDRQAREPSVRAPSHLSSKVLNQVRSDLLPAYWRVVLKLAFIHAAVSLGTLSVCPQFGVRVRGEGMGIMHWFMGLGTYGCALACGTFFLGSSILLAAILLTRPEWRAIRGQRLLTLSALVLPSLGFFKFMDGEFFVGVSLAWITGTFAVGLILMEAVWRYRHVSVKWNYAR